MTLQLRIIEVSAIYSSWRFYSSLKTKARTNWLDYHLGLCAAKIAYTTSSFSPSSSDLVRTICVNTFRKTALKGKLPSGRRSGFIKLCYNVRTSCLGFICVETSPHLLIPYSRVTWIWHAPIYRDPSNSLEKRPSFRTCNIQLLKVKPSTGSTDSISEKRNLSLEKYISGKQSLKKGLFLKLRI